MEMRGDARGWGKKKNAFVGVNDLREMNMWLGVSDGCEGWCERWEWGERGNDSSKKKNQKKKKKNGGRKMKQKNTLKRTFS